MKGSFLGRLETASVILGLLGLWEWYCRRFGVPAFILPPPSTIARTVLTEAPLLLPHCAVTLAECLLGIVLALAFGIPLALVMFRFPSLERALSPFLVASQAVPVFALAPLLVIWLGYGMASKVLMAAVIIFFPVTVSLLEGMKSCSPGYNALFRLMGASFWQSLRLLYWPWALPQFFSGLKVGVAVSTIGAVIGEWLGSQRGLGYLMIQANARMRTDRVFGAILCLTAMGLSLWWAVGYLERRLVFWKRDGASGRP